MGCDIDYDRKTKYYVQPEDMTELLTSSRQRGRIQLVEKEPVFHSSNDTHVQIIGKPVTICGEELGGDWKVIPWAIFLCGKCAEKLHVKTEKW